MPKLIAGFLLGVLVTVAVTQWIDRSEDPKQLASVEREASSVGETDSMSSRSVEAEAGDTKPLVEATEQTEASSATAGPPSPDTVNPVADHFATQDPVTPASSSTGRQGTPAAPVGPSEAPGTNARNEYPPEIAEMIENRVDKDLQARYENDAREDSWAPYMEGLLTNYFSQKPELAQFYISLIDCRTSVCSVHALGYGPEALTQWTVGTADLVEQPWFEFNSMSMNRRNPVPDVLAVVLIVTRNASE